MGALLECLVRILYLLEEFHRSSASNFRDFLKTKVVEIGCAVSPDPRV